MTTLEAAMGCGRVHHAWVFSGPMGVGKCSAAVAFGAMLLDPTLAPDLSGRLSVDPESPTQRMIRAGTHPDLHVITKELAAFSEDKSTRDRKQITIAKEVIEQHLLGPIARAASVRTASIAQKVFIVDEAELMDRSKSNATTQNAMLKTLEEPPAGSVIILVTAAEDRLLTTIRSRCQRVVFQRLDPAAMDRWFKDSVDRIGRPVPKDEMAWIKAFADGSPGRALLAASTGLYEWQKVLAPMLAELDRGSFPFEMGGAMGKLVGAWAESWVGSHKNASKEAANHAAVRHLALLLSEHFRARLRQAAVASDPDGCERASASIENIAAAERHIAANVNMGQALENLSAALVGAA